MMRPKKAPDDDGITNTALRPLPFRMVVALAHLYTAILRTWIFPVSWKKKGRVIMLAKAEKNILYPESNRPITLLPVISQMFEGLMLDCSIPRHGEGLRPASYTSWRPPVQSFLFHRRFHVMAEGALSSAYPVLAGVPQGRCVSPACYSRFTDDIPTTRQVMLALYADNAAYIGSSLNAKHAAVKMQRALDLLPEWLSKWRLSVNVSKTQAMITGLAHLPPPLTLRGADVEWSPRVKYLGVSPSAHHGSSHPPGRGAGQSSRNLLRPVLSSHVNLGVYKTYIRSMLTYDGTMSSSGTSGLRA